MNGFPGCPGGIITGCGGNFFLWDGCALFLESARGTLEQTFRRLRSRRSAPVWLVETLSVRRAIPVLRVSVIKYNFAGTRVPFLVLLGDWLGIGKDAFPGDCVRWRCVSTNAGHHGRHGYGGNVMGNAVTGPLFVLDIY